MSLTGWFCAVYKEGGGCFGRGWPCIADTRRVHRGGHCNDPVNGCQPVFFAVYVQPKLFRSSDGRNQIF